MILTWDPVFGPPPAKATIQVSNDGVNWMHAAYVPQGTGLVADISFAPVNARYVRFSGASRGSQWAYSIEEFEIYAQS